MTPLHLTVSRTSSSPVCAAGSINVTRGSPSEAKECLTALIKANAPLHARDHMGFIPLLRAAFAGNKPGLELLLTKASNREKVEAGRWPCLDFEPSIKGYLCVTSCIVSSLCGSSCGAGG